MGEKRIDGHLPHCFPAGVEWGPACVSGCPVRSPDATSSLGGVWANVRPEHIGAPLPPRTTLDLSAWTCTEQEIAACRSWRETGT